MSTTAIPAVSGPKIRRPVLRYYGGKWRLGARLVQIFPRHHIYTEGFGGAVLTVPSSWREQPERMAIRVRPSRRRCAFI